jgi:hypothetical protein
MSFLDTISEFVCSIAELGETKLLGLRDSVYRLCAGLVMQFAGALVLVFAAVMFFLAMFWAIQSVLGGTIAALLTGAAALLVAVGLITMGSWRAR